MCGGRGDSDPGAAPVSRRKPTVQTAVEPGIDVRSRDKAAERARRVLRPAGALAALDEVASWLAGWQRTAAPGWRNPRSSWRPRTTARRPEA